MTLRQQSYNPGICFPFFPLTDEGKPSAVASHHPHDTWSTGPCDVGIIVSCHCNRGNGGYTCGLPLPINMHVSFSVTFINQLQ